MKSNKKIMIYGLMMTAVIFAGSVIGYGVAVIDNYSNDETFDDDNNQAEGQDISESGQTIYLTIDNNGSSVSLDIGDVINLTLRDLVACGYSWEIESFNTSILQLEERFYWGAPGMPGGSGYCTWLFTAKNIGRTSLILVNERFSGEISETFNVTIVVNESEDEIMIDEDYFFNAPRDPYTINNVELDGDILRISVSYGGGCEEHEFALIGSDMYTFGIPYGTDILLSHDANGDTCKALITEELCFDLTPLSETMILSLEGWEEEILYEFEDEDSEEKEFTNACEAVEGATFRSLEKHAINEAIVEGRIETVYDYRTITFNNGIYEWMISDMIEWGEYECKGWNIYKTPSSSENIIYAGTFNPENGTLIWNNNEYMQVEDEISEEKLQVSLGEEFALHEKQSAVIKDEDFEIKIVEFIYAPCPDGAQCIWSGMGIVFECKHGGEIKKGTNLAKAFGFQIRVIDSDYKTYAKLKIYKIENDALLKVTVSTDKISYNTGENINIEITATNTGKEDISIHFNRYESDFEVLTEEGERVYLWSEGKIFNCGTWLKTIHAGETIKYSMIWDQKDNNGNQVLSGEYTIKGYIQMAGCSESLIQIQ